MCCRNGRNEVADDERPRPGGAIVTNKPANATPCRAWNSQNDVNAANFRFTLDATH
jgi:hypothetical protein